MIKNIKGILCTQEIYDIYSACMFEPTFEKYIIKAQRMQNDPSVFVYGYYFNRKITGVIATQENDKGEEIIGIAVDRDKRGCGIGTELINYVKAKSTRQYIIAETDDDAVLFYEKYGFETQKLTVSKNGMSYIRYACVLRCDSSDAR